MALAPWGGYGFNKVASSLAHQESASAGCAVIPVPSFSEELKPDEGAPEKSEKGTEDPTLHQRRHMLVSPN